MNGQGLSERGAGQFVNIYKNTVIYNDENSNYPINAHSGKKRVESTNGKHNKNLFSNHQLTHNAPTNPTNVAPFKDSTNQYTERRNQLKEE
jgi:hypothetical protein